MDRSPAGRKRAAPPEATPSLLKSSRLLPWQHYVSACARTPGSVSLWTGTPHQPTAGHAAAYFREGRGEDMVSFGWRAAGVTAPGPASEHAML